LAKSAIAHFRLLPVARVVVVACSLLMLAGVSPARAQTIVSMTFDDGIKTQATLARPSLAAHGMHGTFYVNSGNVGANSYYMNWADVDGLNADGNEIGGHTLNHKRLTNLTTTEQRRQVCDDRTALRNRGYTVTDFAYPYGAGGGNATTKSIVKDCGYTSARKVGGIRYSDCSNCPYAETLPPADSYAVASTPYVTGPMTLAKMQSWITQAEDHGGGWVVLMFHDICDGCYDASVSQADFNALLDWLQPRAASGTVVKTVREALDGPPLPAPDTTAPTTSIACNGTSCPSTALPAPVSVTLSASDTGSGVAATRYTTNGSDPTASSTAYTGPITVSQTTTIKFRSWDQAGNVEQVRPQTVNVSSAPTDTTPPTTSISCNGASCPTTALTAPVSIALSASDTGSGVAATRYTTNGTNPTTSSALYTGPFTISQTTTIKFRSWDQAGNAESVRSQTVNVNTGGGESTPSVAITSPAQGASVAGNVTVIVNATGPWTSPPDVDLYVDGQFKSWRTNVVNPYQVPWNATGSGKGTHSLRAWVTDTATGTIYKSAAISVTVTG
jgi:peptidoglycan/xylan/chitin deacetylase (PgdA/CDA1 family)